MAFIVSVFFTPLIFSQAYKLLWSDEFDNSSLDLSKWTFETGNNNGWGNNELEYYTNRTQNCSLQNGYLFITAINESYSGYNYTSARIKTQGKFSIKYGKIEARMKLPFGQGAWPAFWMLGDNINQVSWPACGEIDIMELIGGGSGRDNVVHGSAHWGGDYTNAYTLSSGIFADDFHVFDVTWDAQKIVWHVDGVTYATLNTTPSALSAFQKSFFILFNFAVGGSWPGNPNGLTPFPQSMVVDYVRVYQDTSATPVTSMTAPQNNASFPANSNITLAANAALAGGVISKVEFYQGAMKIGETFVSPYQMTWNNVQAGNYKITSKAYASSGIIQTSDTINVIVGSNASTSPYGGTPTTIPGTIECENYDLGGQNVAYYDTDTQNSGGQYRPSEGVDIETCSDAGGGYDIGYTANNEWLKYTISVQESGTYQIGARIAANAAGGALHFEIDGTDVTGLMAVNATGGWQSWTTITSKSFTLSAGIHQLKLFVNVAGFNINKVTILKPGASPSINVLYPAGGEQFTPGSIVELKWNSQQVSGVSIGYSTNSGKFWSAVQNGVDATFGTYRWKVPSVNSATCKIIVMSNDNTSLFDTSKSLFSITPASLVNDNTEAAKSFSLDQNYPNPFNPSTVISYRIPNSAFVNLSIFNMLGQKINTLVNEEKQGGEYHIAWNGNDFNGKEVPSGIYLYTLHAGNIEQVKKMILMR